MATSDDLARTTFELACNAACGCAEEVAVLRQVWKGYRQDGVPGRFHDAGMVGTLLRLTYHLKRANGLFPAVAQRIRALHSKPLEALAGVLGPSYHDIAITLAHTAVWTVARTAYLGNEILDVLSGPDIPATELRSLLNGRRERVVKKFCFDRAIAPSGIWDSWRRALDQLPVIDADTLIARIKNESARGAAAEQDGGKHPWGDDDPDALFAPAKLADRLGIPKENKKRREALRKRLESWRNDNPSDDGWIEVEGAQGRKPRYFYRVGKVWPRIKDMNTSDKIQ